MEIETPEKKKVHQGHNMKRWRRVMGVTQIDIADYLNITQQAVSKMEEKEEIEPEMLEKVAEIIKIPADIIRDKEPETLLTSMTNTFTLTDTSHGNNLGNGRDGITHYYNCTFHPLDKVTELYERLLEAERKINKK